MAITRIGNPALADVREPNFRNIIINGGHGFSVKEELLLLLQMMMITL
jgi:hypothetical protein